jgi:hypothetical protein
VQATNDLDYPAINGVALFPGLAFLIGNLVVDTCREIHPSRHEAGTSVAACDVMPFKPAVAWEREA